MLLPNEMASTRNRVRPIPVATDARRSRTSKRPARVRRTQAWANQTEDWNLSHPKGAERLEARSLLPLSLQRSRRGFCETLPQNSGSKLRALQTLARVIMCQGGKRPFHSYQCSLPPLDFGFGVSIFYSPHPFPR